LLCAGERELAAGSTELEQRRDERFIGPAMESFRPRRVLHRMAGDPHGREVATACLESQRVLERDRRAHAVSEQHERPVRPAQDALGHAICERLDVLD